MARTIVDTPSTNLLQEDGFTILLENSDNLLTEEVPQLRGLASGRGAVSASRSAITSTRTVI